MSAILTLQFFRNEAISYRQEFNNIPPHGRKQLAARIINTYIMQRAPLRLILGQKSIAKGGKQVLYSTRHVLDQPSFDSNVFDDLAYVVLHELADIYESSGSLSGSDGFLESASGGFRDSAFYQAMKSDLRKHPI